MGTALSLQYLEKETKIDGFEVLSVATKTNGVQWVVMSQSTEKFRHLEGTLRFYLQGQRMEIALFKNPIQRQLLVQDWAQ
jgi:hypothetical protein